jgi:site-specific recombinase
VVEEHRSVKALAESGIPSDHSLPMEFFGRLIAKFLPASDDPSGATFLLAILFSSDRDLRSLRDMPQDLFDRLIEVLTPPNSAELWEHQLCDIREALRLEAARIGGLGLRPEMRSRAISTGISNSPFYELNRRTEDLFQDGGDFRANLEAWHNTVKRSHAELDAVHRHMETEGASVELVFDMQKISARILRMEALVAVLCPANEKERMLSTRRLVEFIVAGLISDRSISLLLRENLSLVARKTVERTGESGEHYIAHDRSEYWRMWRAAFGGGLLTVFTAAIKMRVMEARFPPFLEGFLTGTNYAVSFLIMQMLGLVLATKQPAATAATFAAIVRDNRGDQRSRKIADFVSHITSTQLAAAIGNVLAVSAGAVLFEKLWLLSFGRSFLAPPSAAYVYKTLHPFESLTALYAAITGVILWMAALGGGWCENFAKYYGISGAVSQHPLGLRIGAGRMKRISNIVDRNLGGWATCIILGYLLGFTPMFGVFFGLPLDVRHVTLSSGTLALAAATFGTKSMGRHWFYRPMEGIGLVFILNLGVSFTIAASVAMRAYQVSLKEQFALLRFLLREALRRPWRFLFPPRDPVAEGGTANPAAHN